MAMVRFATTCDRCGARSEEYHAWPSCRECGDDICPACDVPGKRSDDEDNKTTCIQCGVPPSERCHDCGTTDHVSVYDAGFGDRETGASNEMALCAECAEAREMPTSWIVGSTCSDCGLASCGCL